MTTPITTRRSAPLPPDTAEYLRSLVAPRTGPETHEEMRDRYRRAAGFRDLLRQAGWSLTVMADAVGVSRQAVSQWGFGVSDEDGHPPVPVPPPAPEKVKSVSPRSKRVPEEQAARMRELVPIAMQVTRRPDDPRRKAAEELSALMAHAIRDGVNLTRVAEAAGVTRNAVAFRLVRYGYGDLVSPWTVTYVNRVTRKAS